VPLVLDALLQSAAIEIGSSASKELVDATKTRRKQQNSLNIAGRKLSNIVTVLRGKEY